MPSSRPSPSIIGDPLSPVADGKSVHQVWSTCLPSIVVGMSRLTMWPHDHPEAPPDRQTPVPSACASSRTNAVTALASSCPDANSSSLADAAGISIAPASTVGSSSKALSAAWPIGARWCDHCAYTPLPEMQCPAVTAYIVLSSAPRAMKPIVHAQPVKVMRRPPFSGDPQSSRVRHDAVAAATSVCAAPGVAVPIETLAASTGPAATPESACPPVSTPTATNATSKRSQPTVRVAIWGLPSRVDSLVDGVPTSV